MKKLCSRKFHFSLILTALLCIVAVFGLFFFYYIQRFGQSFKEENRSRLSEVSDYIANYMEKMLSERQVELNMLASFVSTIDNEAEQVDYLGNMSVELGFEYIGIAGSDGKLESAAFQEKKDVSNEPFFKASLAGEAYISDITRQIFYDKAVGGIIISVPVPGDKGQVLAAMLSASKLGEDVQVDSFNKEGYSYIINREGDLVIHARSMEYNNLFQSLQNMEFASGCSLDILIEDINNQREGMTEYFDFGIEKYAYYHSMGINGWTVVSTVPAGVITMRTALLLRNLVELCAAAMIIFIVLLTFVCTMFLRLEGRRRENQAKSTFLANMSHDMRTPMNAIIGMTAIAAKHTEEPETVRDCLKKITISSRHLLRLINDILDMARIESGKMVLRNEDFTLSELFEDLVDIIYPLIREKDQYFLVRLHHIKHEQLLGDRLRVSQAFINILTNAVKFTPGGGKIIVEIEELPTGETNQATFIFTFSDNGIGMKPDFLNHIFSVFSREQDSKTDKIEGSGLGMAITKNIIDLMDGKIEVQSEEGKGTDFYVTLTFPVSQAVEEEYQKIYTSVLLVGGEALQGDETVKSLEEIGVKAIWVSDISQALQKIQQTGEIRYQAVLIDREFFYHKDLDMIFKECSKKTVFALAAYDWEDIRLEAAEKGISDFVQKPLFLSVLKRFLSSALVLEDTMEFIEPDSFDFHDKSILLAEDNEMNLEIIKCILLETGAHICSTTNGAECAQVFSDSPVGSFDLILMDIQMPIANGYEATRIIRNTGRPDSDIPIFAMSANAYPEDIMEAKKSGMSGYLTKPIDMSVWLKEISHCLVEDSKN